MGTIRGKTRGKTKVEAFYSPGAFNDGGGFVIYVDRDGHVHIKRIPPWDPYLRGQIQLAAALVGQAEKTGNAAIASQMRDLAQTIVRSNAEQIVTALQEAQG